jgi:stringent starvation protein B
MPRGRLASMASEADKRETLLRLLAEGMVMVHLDARRPGVKVPRAHRTEALLRLNLSYRFASRDLTVDEDGVRCTLSFSGVPYLCELPLPAIFAVTSHVSGESMVWPESLPSEAQRETLEVQRGVLKAVPPPSLSAESDDEPMALPSRAHLRLIK